MPHQSYVLIGQGGWVTKLAEGLHGAGFPVGVVPLGSARRALDPRTWSRVWSATVLVRVGFRPGAQTWRGRAFDSALKIFGRRAKVVCYWIGTDVMNLTDDIASGVRVAGWRTPAFGADHHLAGSEPLQKELAAAGIAATALGFPWRTVDPPRELPPFPSQFTVLSYVPDSRADFYGGPTLLAAAQRFPDVRFEVMGGAGSWAEHAPPNLHFLGWVDDPAVLYSRASCVVRIVDHDSIGGTAVEGLLFGRPVLYSQELAQARRVDANPDSLCAALGELVEEWATGRLAPNMAAAECARVEFDHVTRFEGLARHLAELPTRPRQPRLTYLTLQATTEGQAAHAHVHEMVKGLAAGGWSSRVLKPRYGHQSPTVVSRLVQFTRVQYAALIGLPSSDVFYIRSHFAALPAAMIARRLRVPVVQEVNGPHNDAVVAWPLLRAVRAWVKKGNRIQFRAADAVITVTPQLVRWLQTDAGVEDGYLVSNGADVERFTPDAARPAGLPNRYVVFFGALAPWQGIEVALDATLSDQWPDGVALVIAGDGRMREVVEQRTDAVRIVYLGRRPYAEIPGIVSNSLASLLPKSARDHAASGLAPLKLFESMACGVPVIASHLPGLAEIISDADCGLLVEPGSAEDLARAVRSVSHGPADAALMGRRGRESAVRQHSWRSRADDTAAVLRSVVAAHEQSGRTIREPDLGRQGTAEPQQRRPLVAEEPEDEGGCGGPDERIQVPAPGTPHDRGQCSDDRHGRDGIQ